MEGCTDGSWRGTRVFHCQIGRGFFCPVSNLHPDQREAASSQQASNTPPAHRGPSAQSHDPTALAPIHREPSQGSTMPASGYRNPAHGSTMPASGYRDPAHGSTMPASGYRHPAHGSTMPASGYREPAHGSANITVGSTVEIGDPQDPHCGVVRWTGTFPGSDELVVGIELVRFHSWKS